MSCPQIRHLLAGAVIAAAFPPTLVTEAQANKIAFVTSIEGSSRLRDWSDAGGYIGIAAGDAVCQNLASDAGLPAPSEFVAWLSDSSTDAYCHVHGLSGKKNENCGQPTLPNSAGPWVRTDQAPFAARIDLALEPHHRIYTPVLLNEYGVPVASPSFFSHTSSGGILNAGGTTPCGDWDVVSPSQHVIHGNAYQTSHGWTSSGSSACNLSRPLLCMQKGSGPPLPPFWEGGARVFVTQQDADGQLGGVNGADAVCQASAAAVGLPAPNSYLAWISDNLVNAHERFTHNGPWVRIDGIRVADDLNDLVTSSLRTAISVSEEGEYFGLVQVWTGTDPSGDATIASCADWTTNLHGTHGTIGRAYTVSSRWTEYLITLNCDHDAHLYCFSQTDVHILADGFESGDATAWSNTVP